MATAAQVPERIKYIQHQSKEEGGKYVQQHKMRSDVLKIAERHCLGN